MAAMALLLGSCRKTQIDLAGEWRFQTDPKNVGIEKEWFSTTLTDRIELPNSMLTAGKGDSVTAQTQWTGQVVDRSYWTSDEYAPYREPGNIKIPFWLQPELYYVGAAWYQRDIEIPVEWGGQFVELFLERCHWQTMVWLDDQLVGKGNTMAVPETFDLTELLTPGHHTLTVRIDNDRTHDVSPGCNAHSISDHTQGNWNGIVGRMTLALKPASYVSHIEVYPSLSQKKVDVVAQVRALEDVEETLTFRVGGQTLSQPCSLRKGENTIRQTIGMDDMKAWDEFTPTLYSLQYSLDISKDKGEVSFGFRDLESQNGYLSLNGHPLFLRGTLDCAAFPLTGYPPTTKEGWMHEFTVCKEYGLNHVRFHSWCPPEAAFQAADELGLYLYVECSCWANEEAVIGQGNPIDGFIMAECNRILSAYGNHPSFCMLSYGNEPCFSDASFFSRFVNHCSETDPRHLYAGGAGWPNVAENQFYPDMYPRIQRWGEGLSSIINTKAPSTAYDFRSVTTQYDSIVSVGHEVGQWCVYPNFEEIKKYTGVLKAHNFEIFRDKLEKAGMGELAPDFLYASGRLQTLCYKADIEGALRTPHFGGFQLLGLNDFPGQGTALVGAVDPFWDDKGYTGPAEYRRFCNSLVPLVRMDSLIYANDDTLHAQVEVANFWQEKKDATLTWKITDKEKNILQQGKLPCTLPMGNCLQAGEIQYALSGITRPQCLNLEVAMEGTEYANDWNFWVYPAMEDSCQMGDIRMVDRIDSTLVEEIRQGATVLLSLRKGTLQPAMGGDIAVGFSSIFWNTAWTAKQPPHTLGILCDPEHPALAQFPTESYSDFEWQDAMSHAQAIRLDLFEQAEAPIVRIIDDWFTARPLALLAEARYGQGRILISGADLFTDMSQRLSARQLLSSIVGYMGSDRFAPTWQLTDSDVQVLCDMVR